MPVRMVAVMRVLVLAAIVGIVIMGALLVQFVLTDSTQTPRTAAERAIAAAEEAVKANPDDAAARSRLAAAYLQQGAVDKAIEQAEFALRLDPDSPDGYYVLGSAQAKQEKWDEALKNLAKASETDGQYGPFYQEVYREMSLAYEAKGDIKQAISFIDKAIAYNPENAPYYIHSGRLREMDGRWQEAAYDYAYALIFLPGETAAIDALKRIEQEHPKEHAKAVKAVQERQSAMGADPHQKQTEGDK